MCGDPQMLLAKAALKVFQGSVDLSKVVAAVAGPSEAEGSFCYSASSAQGMKGAKERQSRWLAAS